MSGLRLLQFLGGFVMVLTLLTPRIRRLRPHARRLSIAMIALYLCAGVVVIGWRIAVGPAAFTE